MSTELPQKVQSRVAVGRITIVAARYNEKYTDALLQNCLDELAEAAPDVEVEVVRVPGAFELPQVARRIAASGKFEPADPDLVIPEGYIDAVSAIVRNKIRYCDVVLNRDYFRYLFGEDAAQ